MPSENPQLEEYVLRQERQRRDQIGDWFFDKQRAVWLARRESSEHTAIKCPRRAAKSTLMAGLQLSDGLDWAGQHYPYIGPTRTWCKTYIWPIFKELDQRFSLGIKFNETDLTWWLPNGAGGKLGGANRDDLLAAFVGGKNRVVCLDEAAFYRVDLRYFFEQIIEPTVADLGGYVVLGGAPAPVMKGLFYEATREEHHLRAPGFDVHEWAVEDNPAMVEPIRELRKRWQARDPHYQEKPWYRRQWKGEWVADALDNVYAFSIINELDKWEVDREHDRFVLGIDTGYSGGMAFVILSYSPSRHPNVVIHEAHWEPKMDLEDIAEAINRYRDRYRQLTVVGDYNNAQLNNDLRKPPYKIPLNDAVKVDKRGAIRTMNTEFEWGRVLVLDPHGASLNLTVELQELKKAWSSDTTVEYDDEGNQVVLGSGEWSEDLTSSTNHCTDAMLYGWRYCHASKYVPPPEMPQPGTKEHNDMIEAKLRQQRKKQVDREIRRTRRRRSWAVPLAA